MSTLSQTWRARGGLKHMWSCRSAGRVFTDANTSSNARHCAAASVVFDTNGWRQQVRLATSISVHREDIVRPLIQTVQKCVHRPTRKKYGLRRRGRPTRTVHPRSQRRWHLQSTISSPYPPFTASTKSTPTFALADSFTRATAAPVPARRLRPSAGCRA